jgi:hypothetical protein
MTAFLNIFVKTGVSVEKMRKSWVNAVVLTDFPEYAIIFGIAKKVIPQ